MRSPVLMLSTRSPLEPRLEAHLHIVWKKYQVFSKAAQKFLEKLQEEI